MTSLRYTITSHIRHGSVTNWSTAIKVNNINSMLLQQGIHRHQTPPRYRNASSGSRLKVQLSTHRYTAHYGPNVTSSIKPEVHYVSQRRQRRTKPRLQRICIKKLSWRSVQRFQRYARGQTDTQTDRQTDRNTPLPCWGGVITITHYYNWINCNYKCIRVCPITISLIFALSLRIWHKLTKQPEKCVDFYDVIARRHFDIHQTKSLVQTILIMFLRLFVSR